MPGARKTIAREVEDEDNEAPKDGEPSDDEPRANGDDEVADEDLDDASGSFTVEAIRGRRYKPGSKNRKIQYLIKWENYSEKENTWENEEDMSCDLLVRQFEEKHPREEGMNISENSKSKSPNSNSNLKKILKAEKPKKIRASKNSERNSERNLASMSSTENSPPLQNDADFRNASKTRKRNSDRNSELENGKKSQKTVKEKKKKENDVIKLEDFTKVIEVAVMDGVRVVQLRKIMFKPEHVGNWKELDYDNSNLQSEDERVKVIAKTASVKRELNFYICVQENCPKQYFGISRADMKKQFPKTLKYADGIFKDIEQTADQPAQASNEPIVPNDVDMETENEPKSGELESSTL